MSLKACIPTAVLILHLSSAYHDLRSIYFCDSDLLYTLGLMIIIIIKNKESTTKYLWT